VLRDLRRDALLRRARGLLRPSTLRHAPSVHR
jgi:hypothetical protein